MIKPMLAHEFDKHKHKLSYPVLVQPKLDGVRCIYHNQSFWTRNGKKIEGMPKLLDAVIHNNIARLQPLDGELFSRSMSFQEIVSSVRRTSNIEENLDIEYWIYDYLSSDRPFEQRELDLMGMYAFNSRIRICPTLQASSEAVVRSQAYNFIMEGYEGAIVRDASRGYEQKRSTGLLKLKPYITDECVCIDIVPGLGKYSNTMGALECVYKGQMFRVGSGFSDEQRDNIWAFKNTYLGKTLTVKFQSLTDGNIPRFPVFLEWRNYE